MLLENSADQFIMALPGIFHLASETASPRHRVKLICVVARHLMRAVTRDVGPKFCEWREMDACGFRPSALRFQNTVVICRFLMWNIEEINIYIYTYILVYIYIYLGEMDHSTNQTLGTPPLLAFNLAQPHVTSLVTRLLSSDLLQRVKLSRVSKNIF